MSDAIVQSWLAFQCQSIPEISRALVAFADPDGRRLQMKAGWPQGDTATPALTTAARTALGKQTATVRAAGRAKDGEADPNVIIAYPLSVGGRPVGAVAVEVPEQGEERRNAVVKLLQWGAGWFDNLLDSQHENAAERVGTVVNVIAIALEQERFANAAVATVTELAQALACERVSLGRYRAGEVQVEAISNSARFKRNTTLVCAIESMMEEAVSQGVTVTLPVPEGGTQALVSQAHAAFAQANENPAICSALMVHNRQVSGVLSFERPTGQNFESHEVDLIEAMACLLAPTLDLKRKHDRWLGARSLDVARALLARLLGPRHLASKMVALGAIALAAGMYFAHGTYRVAADASLEGSIRRVVVAPQAGYIAHASARAGDLVEQGDVLAVLDDKDVKLQRLKWVAKRDQSEREYREALTSHDRSRAAILRASGRQAQAELELVEAQLERMKMVAPFAGVIVSGDLSQSIGAPVEQGEVLFEVAPLGEYRIVLGVSELDVAAVLPGARGLLALNGLPNERLPILVERVTPVSQVTEGRNEFRVEARLDTDPTGLRPGMQGVGKIEIGERRLLWIWTHDVTEWLRLKTWAWWP